MLFEYLKLKNLTKDFWDITFQVFLIFKGHLSPLELLPMHCMNCGIYAIAYAFHAANGDDLCLLIFEEEQMQTHLLQCYEVQCLKPFPITSDKVVRCRGKKMLVNLNAN